MKNDFEYSHKVFAAIKAEFENFQLADKEIIKIDSQPGLYDIREKGYNQGMVYI